MSTDRNISNRRARQEQQFRKAAESDDNGEAFIAAVDAMAKERKAAERPPHRTAAIVIAAVAGLGRAWRGK